MHWSFLYIANENKRLRFTSFRSIGLLLSLFFALYALACTESSLQSKEVRAVGGEEQVETNGGEINDVDHGMIDRDGALESQDMTCESTRRPIIFVHGFLAAGDTWSRQVYRLIKTGSCPEWIRAYDWNSLDMGTDHTENLARLVDELIELSGREQVDLVGHSAGGGVSYDYLSTPENEVKIAHYVHIGSFPNEEPAGSTGGVSMLNLWSAADTVVDSADIPGAVNISLEELDHYAIATSFQSYLQLSYFLYSDEMITDDPYQVSNNDEIRLFGRSVSLGENQVNAMTQVQVWSLDERGSREVLVTETETNTKGLFTLTGLSKNTSYEIVPTLASQSEPSVRYFTPPLDRNNDLFYLRTFPEATSLAGLLTRQLPQTDDQVSLVIFNAHRAFLAGADSLTLNGEELLTAESASAENTTIALFVFDIDADGDRGGQVPLFETFPFLAAIDYPLTPDNTSNIELNFNGKRVILPKESSNKGALVVVFP